MYGINETVNFVPFKYIVNSIKKKPNVIFTYWLSTFVNVETLYSLSKYYSAPIFFHISDMATFTGGCHFSLDCVGFEKSCFDCPGTSTSTFNKLVPYKNVLYKNFYLNKMKHKIIAPTSDIKYKLRKSTLFSKSDIHMIPYTVDKKKWYKSNNKTQSKLKLNLNKDCIVIFFAALNFKQERKGFKHLKKVLLLLVENVGLKNILFISAGRDAHKYVNKVDIPIINLGLLKNDHELLNAYQASDIFLNTSIDDIGPYMLPEAMLCELVVISYNVGLAKDLISNEESGFICENKDFKKYYDNLLKAISLSQSKRNKIGKKARNKAESFHNWKNSFNRYLDIFENLD
tara:strand:+ start:4869 stop:5900 length:1032 start_codon:yes stop_codon:yes gene_type:complete